MNNQMNNQMSNQISVQSIAIDCLNSLKYMILRDSFGIMECATPQVRQEVKSMTEDHMKMADEWFRLMANKGWYKVPQADSNLANQMYDHIQNMTKQQTQQRQQRQQPQQQQTPQQQTQQSQQSYSRY
ncbi:MAG: spore coat protein [Bacillota bacterium]